MVRKDAYGVYFIFNYLHSYYTSFGFS
jgi:hypothetical protein